MRDGSVDADTQCVCVLTGNGLKDPDTAVRGMTGVEVDANSQGGQDGVGANSQGGQGSVEDSQGRQAGVGADSQGGASLRPGADLRGAVPADSAALARALGWR